MRKFSMAVLTAFAAASAASPVAAATVSTNLGVKITIQNACTVATPSDLNFGTQGVLAADIDQSTNLSVTCTSGAAYTVGLGVGSGSGATTAVRKMTGAGGTVDYTLYRDGGRTQLWGTATGQVHSGTGTGSAQTIPVYGRVPAQATPAAGAYSDTVAVTVTF